MDPPSKLQEWVDLVFAGAKPGDFDRLSRLANIWGPDQATLLRVAEVFQNAPAFLQFYTDDEVNQTFWDLSANVLYGLGDESIDWAVRHRLILSFEPLFREFFAARCSPVLGHLSEEGTPVNLACYMWWDFDCWPKAPDPLHRNRLDSDFLASMKAILLIDHLACRESALHGLGHWHHVQPSAVESIIDEFLKRERHAPEALRAYALAARCGCVQ